MANAVSTLGLATGLGHHAMDFGHQAIGFGHQALAYLDTPSMNHVKNAVFLFVVANVWSKVYANVVVGGPARAIKDVLQSLKKFIFKHLRRLPPVQAMIDKELQKTICHMEEDIMGREGTVTRRYQLPDHGMTEEQVIEQLQSFQTMRAVDWQGGRVSGGIYHGGQELTNLLAEAFRIYAVSNPLHPEVFPGVRRMEAESVAMVLHMYNAPSTGCGTMTSGGTESILMACKTYRDMYKDKNGITSPEIVAPETIHAAFMKAAEYFGIKLILVPVDPVTYKADVRRMARAITRNTIMIAGSAVNFPHGVADDIVALGQLAKRRKVGLHVDCCLGSFIMPFLSKAGFRTTPFDFSVEGVTSISCDTHKYGFAAKGSSIVMYRDATIRKYQYFFCSEWTGGIYASPSIAGSRPGALIAGCWAALMYMGEDGYLDSCKKIIGARQTIQSCIESLPELHVIGDPIGPVVSFGVQSPVNIYDVGDQLSSRGWGVSALQNPPALHISVTLLWVPVVDEFIADLKESLQYVLAHPSGKSGSTASIYGTAASIPDKSIIEDACAGFLDLLYKA